MKLAALFVLISIFSLRFTMAQAAPVGAPVTWQGEIDGIPMWITVVPRGHEVSVRMREQSPWWNWGNATTDAYLFAVQRPDNVRLILDFDQHADDIVEARIYLNQMGKAPIAYSLRDETLHVHSNAGYPYITLRSENGGWFREEKVNYDLQLFVDGPLKDFGAPDVRTDGQIDVSSRVGSSRSGAPDWQSMQLVYDPQPSWSYPRFNVWKRMSDAPPFKVASGLLPGFPHFGLGAKGVNWFQENPLPFYFHVEKLEFQLLPFPGFQNGGMYNINSLTLPPDVDFESPFVFYSFDPTTRYAQLVVRAQSFPTDSQFGPEPKAIARSTFRYSWKAFDNTRWAFALHFAGNYAYTQQLQIGDQHFLGVPGPELATWVASREWPMVTFVEATEGYPGSEGIYFYTSQSDTGWSWLSGMAEEPPAFLSQPFLAQTSDLTDISRESLPAGFRGEYNSAYFRTPEMYLSPIDNLVHLLHAEGGVWNLGNDRILRVHNLDGDAYIDGWTREKVSPLSQEEIQAMNEALVPSASPGEVEEGLYAFDKFLIYTSRGQAELREVDYQPATFQFLPPVDRMSWQLFREQLAPYAEQTRDPQDLRSWLTHFSGKVLFLRGGQISDVRPLPDGFRFVLDLHPDFDIQQNDLIDLQRLKPGRYAVIYTGQFTVEPLTPPILSLSFVDVNLTYLQPSAIQVALSNTGLQDIPQANLELWATSPDGITGIVADQSIQLPARESFMATLQWAPTSSGNWRLTPKIRRDDGYLISGDSISVLVASRNDDFRDYLSVSTSSGKLVVSVLGLISLAGLTAVIFWREWGAPLVSKRNDNERLPASRKKENQGRRCPICQTQEEQRRAGFNRSGSRRYRCDFCKRVYTPNPNPRGYPIETRMLAIRMSLDGKSYKAISRILGVSPQSVSRWVKQFAAKLPAVHDLDRPTVAHYNSSYSSAAQTMVDGHLEPEIVKHAFSNESNASYEMQKAERKHDAT